MNKVALMIAAVALMGASVGHAAHLQPLNIPPADVNDPLYKDQLLAPAGPVPATVAPTLPNVHPTVDAIRDSTRIDTMRRVSATTPLRREIGGIVGAKVMAFVRNEVITSLSDPANNLGVPARMVPFNR